MLRLESKAVRENSRQLLEWKQSTDRCTDDRSVVAKIASGHGVAGGVEVATNVIILTVSVQIKALWPLSIVALCARRCGGGFVLLEGISPSSVRSFLSHQLRFRLGLAVK